MGAATFPAGVGTSRRKEEGARTLVQPLVKVFYARYRRE
jgi:hypothetical protein